MKYLLITMMLMIGLLFPKNILSEERRFWYKGDSIISAFICHKEKDIMKIVKADTISEEEVLATDVVGADDDGTSETTGTTASTTTFK